MKTILVVVKNIDGGTGKFVESLQQSSQEYFIKTIVFEQPLYRKTPDKYIFLSDILDIKKDYFDFVDNIKCFYRDWKALNTQIIKIQPTIILSIDVYVNIIVLMQKIFLIRKYKVIITNHNFLSEVLSKKTNILQRNLVKLFVRFLYNFADIIIAVSQGVKNDLIQNIGIKRPIQLLYNGVQGHPSSLKSRTNKKHKGIIISIGRLVEQKDFITLIRAFDLAQRTDPSLRLWIVGDGELKNMLLGLSNKLKLSKKITFFGWRQDIGTLLKKADMFVLSSRWEGLPYVIIEAMSFGLPIIATDSPHGVSELLDKGKYGTLVTMGDSVAMSGAILHLSSNEAIRIKYGNKSIRRWKDFTLKKMQDNYISLFKTLLS